MLLSATYTGHILKVIYYSAILFKRFVWTQYACPSLMRRENEEQQYSPMTTAMTPLQIFRTTVMSLNQQNIPSNVVHQTRVVTALRFQVSHPSRYLQWLVMFRTFQLQFESTHRTPDKHLVNKSTSWCCYLLPTLAWHIVKVLLTTIQYRFR